MAVVAGFQGVSREGRITTLGRGGSDTSAVALAAAFKAERCDIYTDVDGVYTSDPRIVKKAQKLETVTYEEMLEMASLGSKVLQTRSVELAMNYHVHVQVRSTFDNVPGTMLVDEEEKVEQRRVTRAGLQPATRPASRWSMSRTAPAFPPPCSARWPMAASMST